MTCIIDSASEHIEIEDEKRIARVRLELARSQSEPFIAGECELCGEDRPRLVKRGDDWACTFCRDTYRLG